jgi:hypothetical protein
MSQLKLLYLFGLIFTSISLIANPLQANAAQKENAQSDKERLVLMPLRLGEEDKTRQAAMETALAQGLQQKYEVFSGEVVAKKARDIFLKESRNLAHTECDEVRCFQDIAEAFQAELIAIVSVSKEPDGYFLALSIQNIFDHKVVYSNSIPCKGCDAYQVVAKLKELSGMVLVTVAATPTIAPTTEEELPPLGRFNLHLGTELRTATSSYTNIYNNLNDTSKTTDIVLGLTSGIGEASSFDVSYASGSGTHNLYAPAADQPVTHTRMELTYLSIFSGDRKEGWKYFAGYKDDTTKSTATGQAFKQDTFDASGLTGGVNWHGGAMGGTVDCSLEANLMSATWTDDSGFNAVSGRTFGTKFMLSYAYNFTRKLAGAVNYSQQSMNYNFSTFQVAQSSSAMGLNLLFNF